MRPGNQSNKRMRGRGRKGPNPLTRTYESNGPDVKIRGTAMHVAEKYQQLARDAQASGDRVMSENYNQHAEHYLRIVAAAQPQQQPMAHASSRNEAEDGFEAAATNGSGHSNGAERPSQDVSSSDNDLMDADSPQPFIDDMPVIDQEGKVNGASQKAEKAEAGDDEADEKPRRRPGHLVRARRAGPPVIRLTQARPRRKPRTVLKLPVVPTKRISRNRAAGSRARVVPRRLKRLRQRHLPENDPVDGQPR